VVTTLDGSRSWANGVIVQHAHDSEDEFTVLRGDRRGNDGDGPL
jgi:hypothetical protein